MQKAFTLIELLVVVLIIGILSAIALPQYQKAVIKSRFAEAIANLKTLAQAEQVCYMEKGSQCVMEELPIQTAGELSNGGTDTLTENFRYHAGTQDTDGNPVWGYALYRRNANYDEDVCLCYLQTGEIVVGQDQGCANGRSMDYDKLLNLRDAGSGCVCC